MSKPPPSKTLPLSDPTASGDPGGAALARLRADQWRRWEQGERVPVETYLEQHPSLRDNPEAVLDLIYSEVVLRQQRDEEPRLEDYQQRFPQMSAQLKDLFDVHRALEAPDAVPATLPGDLPPTRAPAELASLSGLPDDDATEDMHPPTRLEAVRPAGSARFPQVAGYEVVGKLGSGTFGVVYQARDLRLRRTVALKMIRAGVHADAQEVARFRLEAEAVARLRHPNIVQIYEVGEHDGLPYLALEFIAGSNLAEQLDGTPLPARAAAGLMETLARAMHHAHQQGVIHRDLKPGNILLQKETTNHTKDTNQIQEASTVTPGTPAPAPAISDSRLSCDSWLSSVAKITDFGLAKQLDRATLQTQSGAIMGTPSYMAPEQAAGKVRDIGPAADVYALGAILYELLTGRPPFRAETPLDTVLLVLSEEPVPPRFLQPKVARELETICLKCLEKDPGKRYASALDLAEDLRRFQAGEPITARPISWWGRGVKWARRRPAVAALVGVSVLAALTLVIGGLIYHQQIQAALRETRRRELAARRNLYVAQMNLAQRAWHDAQVGRVEELLNDTRPADPDVLDLRGFEWYYLRRLCHSALLTLPGDSAVAYSPDGSRLASAGPGNSVVIRDSATGKPLQTLRGHTAPVTCVAFSPDGHWLASAGEDRTVRLWDALKGEAAATLQGHAQTVLSVAFSPAGRLLASAGRDGLVKIWDVGARQWLRDLKGHEGPVRGVAFRPGARSTVLASAGEDGTVRIWNAANGDEINTLSDHDSVVAAVAFSPDGKRLASASWDQTVMVWTGVTSGQRRKPLTLSGHEGAVMAVAFGPDGKRLASAGADRTVKVWDVDPNKKAIDTDKALFTYRGHRAEVVGIAYQRDGQRLASVGRDQTVLVWDPTQAQQCRTLLQSEDRPSISSVAFHRDGRLLAAAGYDGSLKLWDVRSGTVVRTLGGHTGPIPCVAFSPDGRLLASAGEDRLIQLWDVATGRKVKTLPRQDAAVAGVDFSPDGQRLVSADGRTVRVWNLATDQAVAVCRGHTAAVRCVAFHPDGRRLASASQDGTVRLWDASTGQALTTLAGHAGAVYWVAFRPDGRRLVSAGADRTLVIWDVATGDKVRTCRGHTSAVQDVCFSPDGRRLASASGDHTVKIWDAATCQETLTLSGHSGAVNAVEFSRDGTRLASGGARGEIKIWDGTP